jgi:hypothetical protein
MEGGGGGGGCLGMGHGGEAQIKGTHTHGGRYVQYNIYGNLFEVSAKYVPPIRPVGRGACGIIWCVLVFSVYHMATLHRLIMFDLYSSQFMSNNMEYYTDLTQQKKNRFLLVASW